MSAKSYTFRIGQAECMALHDGTSPIGIERFLGRFPDATEAEYREAYEALGLSLDAAESSMNVLVVRLGAETVLVDSGMGQNPPGGLLPESLRLAGVAPAEITTVVITHSHGDHVLGLLDEAGAPRFPRATYVISRPELAFWEERTAGGMAAQRPIVAMMGERGLRRIAMDEAILPGLTAIPLPGHTPGQVGLLLESEGERLFHLADLLHSPMQIAHPEWSAAFDADTARSVPTRRAALARVAKEGALAFFYHLPFPGLGHIGAGGDARAWEPVAPAGW